MGDLKTVVLVLGCAANLLLVAGCRVAFNCEIGNSTKSTVALCP
jgi:hypothetical protein